MPDNVVQISQVSLNDIIKAYNDLVEEYGDQGGAGPSYEPITLDSIELNSLTQAVQSHPHNAEAQQHAQQQLHGSMGWLQFESHCGGMATPINTVVLPPSTGGATISWQFIHTPQGLPIATPEPDRQYRRRPVQLEFDHEFFRMK